MSFAQQLQEASSKDVMVRGGANWDDHATGQKNLAAIQRSGHLYRGMTSQEYKATVGRGKPVMSTGAFSHSSEGTSFTDDPGNAEDYANVGRDDPRKTGKPTWMIEVRKTKSMYLDTDGYTKDKQPVSSVTRVWKMYAKGENIFAKRVK